MTLHPRLRQVFTVGSVESLGVIIGGLSGLLIVHMLPKDQYAAYTFLVACITLVLGVTDTGLAHCCLPVVGERADNSSWVMASCARVFQKRWALLVVGFFIVVPYWFYTTRQHGWEGGGYWMASAVILISILLALREHYAGQVLVILGQIPTLNRVGYVTTGVRIVIICAVLAIPIGAYSLSGVLAASAASSIVAVMLYRKAFESGGYVEMPLSPVEAKEVDKKIYKIAKPLVLPAVFYQFQGVITVFIASMFGNPTMLAEVGAFGRLSMALVVFDRIAATVLFPIIARSADGGRLMSVVVKGHLAYLGAMFLVFLTSIWLPQYWILLIGSKYADRESLVWMVFAATLLMNGAGFAFRTVAARGHTERQTLIIPFVLAFQIGYLWLFGISSLRAVLGFGISTCLANFLYQYAMLATWYMRQRRMLPSGLATDSRR